MQPLVAQYIAGAIVLIFVFLLLSDPAGSADILNSIGYVGASQIGALQGRAVSQPSKLSARKRG